MFFNKIEKRVVKNEERVNVNVFLFFWKLKPWDRSGSEDSPNTLLDKFP